ncbi:unnamed protein product, partial [Acanthocheilonema viteae]
MANVMLAAYNAIEATVRMLCPDLYKNMEITDMIDKIASIYQKAMAALREELAKHKIELQRILDESTVLTEKICIERICTYDRSTLISLMEAICVQLDAALEKLRVKMLK